jgi:hypothetical protein
MPQVPLDKSDKTLSEYRNIRDQYYALVPPRLIRLPPATALASLEGQAYLLSNLLEEVRFPQPEDGYRRLFWRGVLRELELVLSSIHGRKEMPEDEEEDVGISNFHLV